MNVTPETVAAVNAWLANSSFLGATITQEAEPHEVAALLLALSKCEPVRGLVPLLTQPVWLVWSREHDAWWGAHHSGYFTDIGSAGRYTLVDAIECCGSRSRNRKALPPESIILAPETEREMLAALKAALAPFAEVE